MGKFGWDLPPGVSHADIERAAGGDCDDSVCAECEKDLPEEIEPGSWPFQGFCDAKCAAECFWQLINRYRSKNLAGSIYDDFETAFKELLGGMDGKQTDR